MLDKFMTTSVGQTHEIASKIASKLHGGEILLLHGDLGSGKTTFTQGLASSLGISRRITSPTFIIMRSYELKIPIGAATSFYHLDLYRTNTEKEIYELGIFEILGQKENIVAIEWPEKLPLKNLTNTISLHFKFISESNREINIDYDGII